MAACFFFFFDPICTDILRTAGKLDLQEIVMEQNNKGGIELSHQEIESILIDAVEKKYPKLAADRHPDIRFSVSAEGIEAEVFFGSYN